MMESRKYVLKFKNILRFLICVFGLWSLVFGLVSFQGCTKQQDKTSSVKEDSSEQKKILHWTCGMHPSVKSDKPGNCPICNMKLIPVYKEIQEQQKEEYYGCGVKEEGHCPHCDEGIKDAKCICGGHSFLIEGKSLKTCPVCKKPLKKIEAKDLPTTLRLEKATKKILYYRNPMNPAITSKVPMKDQMGMDYIPVYAVPAGRQEEEETTGELAEEKILGRIRLNQTQLELAGLETQEVVYRKLFKEIRTVGKIAYDPELAVAQEEFLTALETREKVSQSRDPDVIARAQDILDKSKFRLRLLGMSDEEISQLQKDRATQLHLILPGDKAWVYADVYEYELSWVKVGQEVLITVTAYPGEEFKGVIKSITPVLDPMTRSVKVRFEVDNRSNKLKPEMFVDVVIKSVYTAKDGAEEVLAVVKEAVLDTGTRKLVYVSYKDGVFIGKEVEIGPEASSLLEGKKEKFYPIISGLEQGDRVVTKANFLIDSQSQISGTAAAAAYGGALGSKEETEAPAQPPLHQH